jgi:hypothetical protein
MPFDLGELVGTGDPAALLRAVDGLCAADDWDDLVELLARLEEAIEFGKPLWPVRTYVEYRLALEAPGRHAASVLRPGAARFALGPLTEVAASAHPWADLAPHLDTSSVAGAVAQERVLRGEDLRGDPRAHPEVLELPMVLQPWEPAYPLATYRRDRLHVTGPPTGTAPKPAGGDPAAARLDDAETHRALLGLVEVWTSQSEGTADAVLVDGGAADAAAALAGGPVRLARLTPAEALALMAWAAASGGAHGVRRGAALGRFDSWWAATVLSGLDWPPEPDQLAAAIERLDWWAWDDGPLTGWVLRLAVADRGAGWAAAVDARDVATPETADLGGIAPEAGASEAEASQTRISST